MVLPETRPQTLRRRVMITRVRPDSRFQLDRDVGDRWRLKRDEPEPSAGECVDGPFDDTVDVVAEDPDGEPAEILTRADGPAGEDLEG